MVRSSAYGLVAAARHHKAAVLEGVIERLKANKHQNSCGTQYAVFLLGEIGATEAIAPLERMVSHVRDIFVRRAIAEALGNISDLRCIAPLLELAGDADDQTRFQAVLSLAKLARHLSPDQDNETAHKLVRMFAHSLYDNDRYVQSYALEGLKRMRPFEEAQDILMRTLFAQRWCPITNKASAF